MENWWRDDPGARIVIERRLEGAEAGLLDKLDAAGARVARDLPALSAAADRHRPVLHRYEPRGTRRDHVEYHPSYQAIRTLAREVGIVASAYGTGQPGSGPAPRPFTMALGYLFGQSEAGYYCPVCLTDATAFVLARHANPSLAAATVPKLASPDIQSAFEGAMFLTERDGGSDVGGGTKTVAESVPDGTWRLTGAKWFCSNVDADVALTLARMPGAPGGTKALGLFLLPRTMPDGSPNLGIRIERLKDKLGVTSMATGEIELDDAFALLVKPAPDGFRAMTDMLNVSRIYNSVASVAVGRAALRMIAEEGRRRATFGRLLREHALWRRNAIDAAVSVEAAFGLVFEAVRWMDADPPRPGGARSGPGPFAPISPSPTTGPSRTLVEADAKRLRPALRAITPIVKAGTARRAVAWASLAVECLGGNGYVEDFPAARLLRDAQVLPIWEGSANVLALDLLRAQEEGALSILFDVLEAALPSDGPERTIAFDALSTSRRMADESAKAPREERESTAAILLERCYEAALLSVLAADAAWEHARGGNRKARVFQRLRAAPPVDSIAEYGFFVEGEPAAAIDQVRPLPPASQAKGAP
ncbi:MAG: acyl-CoA dehydrogenase family protein [Thermoplasmatota archaeon]